MSEQIQLTSPFAEGRTADVYEWGQGKILKLYRDWCPGEWIENEIKVAQTIYAAGIPTPEAVGVIETYGRRGIVYERINGISMLQDMNKRPWKIIQHARKLAELQAQYQKITIPGLFSYNLGFR